MATTSDPLPEDTDALKAALIETRAKLSGAEALIEDLQLSIAKMKRELFGPHSERTQSGSAIFQGVLEAARRQLLLDFDAAKGFAHSGIRGEERAEALGAFLRSRLPPAFGVSTGEVIDRRDQRSGQLDLVIYDQTVTRAVYAGQRNELYPCEAVYAAVEVKSLFTRGEAAICLRAAQKLRNLSPFGQRLVSARSGGKAADDSAYRCMYVVFAYATDLGQDGWLQKEYSRLVEVAQEEQASISVIDRLLILDRGILNPVRTQGRSSGSDPGALFAEFFLHLTNFVERERRRRPALSWQTYALPRSFGWRTLKRTPDTQT
jgi:hypothetical protein